MDSRHHSIQLSGSDARKKGPVSDVDGTMSSELYLAVCKGRKEEAMALLLQQGSGIYQVSAERNTVLHLAAEQGHDELIQELYTSCGDNILLSSQNSALETPLHCAARAGHDRAVSLIVQLIWDSGDQSIIGCKNKVGDTALHLASRLGHGMAVEAMVSVAPRLASEVNDAGVSALYLAVMSGSVPAVRAITTVCSDASAAGPSLQNALHAAIFRGSEMVSLLLDWKPSGQSLSYQADSSGSSPLHFASSDGDRAVVGAILRASPLCVVRMQDSGGLSALHVAAGMGYARIAKALIKACPDITELRDDRGRTFLHTAARGSHSKVVWLAIRKQTLRSLLNVQDGDGNTPLHLAVVACAPGIVEALMRHGKVRADVMNNDGHTPFDLAARSTSFFSTLGLVVTLAAFGAESHPQRQDCVEQWSGHDITKRIEKTTDSLAVVAVLIATVAFTAANSMPGSYEQADGTAPDRYGNMVSKGMAVLQGRNIFKCFLVLDSFALVTSVVAVVLLVFGKASRSAGSWKSLTVALHCIWVSLISMLMAFYAALATVTSTRAVYRFTYYTIFIGFAVLQFVVTCLIFPPVKMRTLWKVLWRTGLKGRYSVLGRRIRQQYPVAGFFVPNLLIFLAINCLFFVGFPIILYLGGQGEREATLSRAPAPSSVLS